MIRGHPLHFLWSLSVIGLCVSVTSSQKDNEAWRCVDSSLSDKTKWHFTKMDNQKKELISKGEHVAKK